MGLFTKGMNSVDIENSRKLKRGDLSAKFSTDCKEVAENINYFLADLKKELGIFYATNQQIEENTHVLSENLDTSAMAFEDILSSVEELSRQMEARRHDFSELAGGVEGLLEETAHSAESAQETIHTMDEMTSRVKEGEDIFLSVIKLLKKSNDSGIEMSQKMESLTKEIKDINSITEEVEGIASKTNLLSLNAAIEAASAGDTGRGFAVVATEIGKLAIQSQEAVGKISETINSVVTKIISIAKDMKGEMEYLERESQVADRSIDALKFIEDSVKKSIVKVEGLLESTKSQEAVGEEVKSVLDDFNTYMAQIHETTEKVRKDADEYYGSSQKIAESITHIETMLRSSFEFSSHYMEGFQLTSSMESRIQKAFGILREIQNRSDLLDKNKGIESRKLLKEVVKKHEELELVCILDKEGYSASSSIDEEDYKLNFKHRLYFKNGIQGKEFRSKAYISTDSNEYNVAIAVPLKDQGQIIGVIMADVKLY